MAAPATTQPNSTLPATHEQPRQKLTTQVLAQITNLMGKGSLVLPADYSAGNALNAAWLKMHEVQNRDQKPLLVNGQLTGIVTQESVVNALHDMVIQGLSVQKTQGYFIVYGQKLTFQRSYFGDIAIAQRLRPGLEIVYQSIHEGDEVVYEMVRGRKIITKHAQAFGAEDKPVIGAYCVGYDGNGECVGAEVMTIAQIRKSWSMSKTYKPGGGGTHANFEAEMAKRTVVRKFCKPIINSSNDALILEAVRRQDEDSVLAEAEDIAIENQNGPMLSLEQANSEPVQIPVQAQEPVKVAQPAGEEDPY